MSERIAKFLVRYHVAILLLAAAIGGVCLPIARSLQSEWKVEGMFPPADPLVDSYHKLQDRFGGNQVVLAVYRDPGLWDLSGEGMQRLEAVTDQLSQVEGVDAVLSLSELHRILETLRNPLKLLNLSSDSVPPLLDPNDELAQSFASVFAGYTHAPGSEYVAIACLLDSDADSAVSSNHPGQHDRTLGRLRSVMEQLPTPAAEGLITGEPVLVADGLKMVRRDGLRLGLFSSFLLTVVLLVCFRSVRWTLIPLAVVHWSLLVTQAILSLLDFNLTMISSTLTAIVTVIGVATSMHLSLKFQQVRRQGHDRETALRETFSTLLAPVSWACITDAVGFSALMTASVGPVRDFGLMMAIGSLAVLLAIVVLVPGLSLLGKWDTDPSIPKYDLIVRWFLRKILDWVLKHRRLGIALLVVLAVVGISGSLRMRIETDFTKNFQDGSSIVKGYDVVERELGGAGVWDIMLPIPGSISSEYLAAVSELEEQLRLLRAGTEPDTLSLAKVLSIADADQASLSAPVLGALPVAARIEGMRRTMPEFMGALLSTSHDESGFGWLRIMLRSRERAPAVDKSALVAAVHQTLDEYTQSPSWTKLFDADPPASEVAGYHVMLGSLVSSVLEDQWKCFLVATIGIFIVMSIATRSVWLALAALAPNALPVLLVLGTMGWIGTRVNMGAAMIAAVSLGLSVDSSIHYLMHYGRKKRNGDRPLKALRSAQENVGLAVVLATIALIAGFVSLCSSEFVPTVVFGTLASLTMLGGLLGNLVLLPVLIGDRQSE